MSEKRRKRCFYLYGSCLLSFFFKNYSMSKFKDTQNRWRTVSLFYETRVDGFTPLFTLKEDDYTVGGVTYPSLRKIYFSYVHVPGYEYEFAITHLGGWEHWQTLCDSQAMVKKTIAKWREEMDILIKAQALRNIMIASTSESAVGLNASRYLSEKGYEVKRGRPSKEEVQREVRVAAGVESAVAEDLKRLNIVR